MVVHGECSLKQSRSWGSSMSRSPLLFEGYQALLGRRKRSVDVSVLLFEGHIVGVVGVTLLDLLQALWEILPTGMLVGSTPGGDCGEREKLSHTSRT